MLSCYGIQPISFYPWLYRYQCRHLLLRLRTFVTDSARVCSRIKHFVKNTLVGPLLAERCLGIPRCDHWVFPRWHSDHSFPLLFVL